MAGTGLDDEAEKPLDPASERLRRKMVRLLAVSIGTMLVAVMAVLGAVVYKIAARPGAEAAAAPTAPGGPPRAAVLALPAGASVEDIALDAGTALLRLREGAQERLLHVDIATGRVLATLTLQRP